MLKATSGMADYVPTEVLLGEETLSALACYTDSLVKFGLQLASPNSIDGSTSHQAEFVPWAMATECLGKISRQLSDLMFVELGVERDIGIQKQ